MKRYILIGGEKIDMDQEIYRDISGVENMLAIVTPNDLTGIFEAKFKIASYFDKFYYRYLETDEDDFFTIGNILVNDEVNRYKDKCKKSLGRPLEKILKENFKEEAEIISAEDFLDFFITSGFNFCRIKGCLHFNDDKFGDIFIAEGNTF